MLKLSAFADEISPDLAEQIRVCKQTGVTHLELRSVNKINVLDFDQNLRREVKRQLGDAGLGVICIGSPIGKVKINDPWMEHAEKFKIAVELSQFFAAPLIRIFSYYPPDKGQDMREHREEVMRRMQAKVDHIKNIDVTLVHENEKAIYGEKGAECLDLMKTVNSPKLRTAFDFANFVQAGEKPLDNWPALKPYTQHIHVKDAMLADGRVVPAGEGDGQLAPIIADAYKSGYRGFLSLEPHLTKHEQFSGFSGPEKFIAAADALKKVCREIGVPLA